MKPKNFLTPFVRMLIYPNDLAKKVGVRLRELKKEVKFLVDNEELAYYYPGSTTYIMLKKDYDMLKELEETGIQ